MKAITDISLKISDEEYYNDGFIHHSSISTYDAEGYNCIRHLHDKKESQSLTFGSAVDAIITGGYDEFNKRFIVNDVPQLTEAMNSIVTLIIDRFKYTYSSINDIPKNKIKEIATEVGYGLKWSEDTVFDKVVASCGEYYKMKISSIDKTIISRSMFSDVINCCDVLKNSTATKFYFEDNDPFDNSIERFYQVKFRATIDGITYSVMFDCIIVDHKNKRIIPIDLKTSSKNEWDFFLSFIKWGYSHQARLYYRVLKFILEQDEYFKDFEIEDFRFIVVNKQSLTPLVWIYKDTKKYGTLEYKNVSIRDPFDLAKSIVYYTEHEDALPHNILRVGDNDLVNWLI